MIYIFLFSVTFIIYVYLLYPIIIYFLSQKKKIKKYKLLGYGDLPELTVVLPVHNDSQYIKRKIQSLKDVNYPQDKIKFTLVSDGSKDDSNDVIAGLCHEFENISSIIIEDRKGKPNALNAAMSQINTDIVVFSDIRQSVSENSLIELVSELMSDDAIGLVCGELVHVESDGVTSKNVGAYWKYEKWIRQSESDYYSTVGTTGALYVFYAKDFLPFNNDVILDDFELPIQILANGGLLKFNQYAFMYDVAHDELEHEKTRKIRTLTGNYQTFMRMKWLFSPFRNPVFFQFISHKVFRLLVPYFMLLSLVSNFFILNLSFLFMVTLGIQVIFYALVFLAKNYNLFKSNALVNLCLVFFELNWSVVYSLYAYVNGEFSVTWKKT